MIWRISNIRRIPTAAHFVQTKAETWFWNARDGNDAAVSIAQAASWRVVGLIMTTTVIAYGVTGSFIEGEALALLAAATGLVISVLRERAWARVRWGGAHSGLSAALTSRSGKRPAAL